MRVIAGTAGGIQLDVPKTALRPTMDRVKGAIFSSLGDRVIGARVLDLFAGTGALGIEALSRGAASLVAVENDQRAISAIERNLAKTGLTAKIRRRDVFDFLRQNAAGEIYDLIFADPPYHKTDSGRTATAFLLESEELAAQLAENGVFVVEKMPSESLLPSNLWQIVRRKTYGATETLFLQPAARG